MFRQKILKIYMCTYFGYGRFFWEALFASCFEDNYFLIVFTPFCPLTAMLWTLPKKQTLDINERLIFLTDEIGIGAKTSVPMDFASGPNCVEEKLSVEIHELCKSFSAITCQFRLSLSLSLKKKPKSACFEPANFLPLIFPPSFSLFLLFVWPVRRHQITWVLLPPC